MSFQNFSNIAFPINFNAWSRNLQGKYVRILVSRYLVRGYRGRPGPGVPGQGFRVEDFRVNVMEEKELVIVHGTCKFRKKIHF